MKMILLLLTLYVLAFLYRIGLNKLHSNLGHNVAKKHLEDKFGINSDTKDNQ